MKRQFTTSQALDHIFAENEAEDREQHSDMDKHVSDDEDDVKYQRKTDTSNESDEVVASAEVTYIEAQYLLIFMAANVLKIYRFTL